VGDRKNISGIGVPETLGIDRSNRQERPYNQSLIYDWLLELLYLNRSLFAIPKASFLGFLVILKNRSWGI
jgi:hypothetical protein